MSTQDVTRMKAGQELDVLVAEKVMGLEVGPIRVIPVSGGYARADLGVKGGSVVPRYSTYIADAWQVVEKMRDKFSGWLTFTKALQVEVSRDLPQPDDLVAPDFVWRLVRPEHICRAALLAIPSGDEYPGDRA